MKERMRPPVEEGYFAVARNPDRSESGNRMGVTRTEKIDGFAKVVNLSLLRKQESIAG
jgi:hypothetical protein